MTSELSIRAAGPQDAEAMAVLHAASFDHAWTAASIDALVGGPGGRAWLASDGDRAVGFALLHVVPPESELLSIGVLPAVRRGGIGRLLLRRAAHDVALEGVETMFLDVAADNLSAIGLYRSLGFRDISKRPRYYPGNVDGIVMQADLADIAH